MFGCLIFDGLEVIAKIVSKKLSGRKEKREEEFSKSVRYYSPSPPIGDLELKIGTH